MTDEHPMTDRQQLVQAQFDAIGAGPVSEWIEQQRQDGKSWAQMSWALRDMIGRVVSYETLRRWSNPERGEAPHADTE